MCVNYDQQQRPLSVRPSVHDKPTTGPARVTLDPTATPPPSPTTCSTEAGRRFYNSTIYNYYLLGEPNLVRACVVYVIRNEIRAMVLLILLLLLTTTLATCPNG